jgi:hypothetical protein
MSTTRRTDEHNLRQAISEILEEIYAIEYSMGLFYRKGNERELARAQEDFETMRAAVDRLDAIVAGANKHDDENAKVVEAAE